MPFEEGSEWRVVSSELAIAAKPKTEMTQRRGESDEPDSEGERGRVDGRGAATHRMVGSHLVAFAAQTALPLLFRLPP